MVLGFDVDSGSESRSDSGLDVTFRVVFGVVVGSESDSDSELEPDSDKSVSRTDAEETEQTNEYTRRSCCCDKRELTFAFLIHGFFLSECIDNGFAQLVDRRFSWAILQALEQGSVNHLLELDSRIKNPIIR